MAQRLWKSHSKAQLPPPDMALDVWADKYRFMTETTQEKWFTDTMEIARGPMRAVTESGVRTITVMCSTQLMKTELLLNTIGYFVHLDPCPILVVQPKDDVAKKFSNVRLKEMINSTPVIKNLFKEWKAKDGSNTTQHKEFAGGHVSIVSAKVPDNLAMFAIRIVLLDEIDKYDASSGKEGDPVWLAEERMDKYENNSLSIRVCSPTVTNFSRIETSYKDSDMRKPSVCCPHCDHSQRLDFRKQVKWDKDEDGVERHETARYVCAACGVFWSEYDRLVALKHIDWLQTKEFKCIDCNHLNKPAIWDPHDERLYWDENGIAHCEECGIGKCSNKHAGFWANKLYSPRRPLSEIVKKWLETPGNIELLKMFINTQLAEPFDEPGQSIKDVEFLMQRREDYGADVPEEVGLLTAGVDTQDDRLEVEVVGWGLDEESWSIEYKVLPGDPAKAQVWKDLDAFLRKPFFYNNESYTKIAAVCIDMQGHHTQAVANYCRRRIGNRIWPIRGVGGDGTARPVWPNNPGRTSKTKVPFYNIGVDAGKNMVFSRLLLEEPGPGYCHFPLSANEEQFKQFTAEKRIEKWRGAIKILVWDNPGHKRNEAFDVRVYAYAALMGLRSLNWRINRLIATRRLILLSDRKKAQLTQEIALQTTDAKVRSNRPRIAKSNFMSR